jgi:predicted secreted acid phosphatase
VKSAFIVLISIAVLCSCNKVNKAAMCERKIKAYQDSAEYMGFEYYTSKADMYADSLSQLNNAKKHNDDHVKRTAASMAKH